MTLLLPKLETFALGASAILTSSFGTAGLVLQLVDHSRHLHAPAVADHHIGDGDPERRAKHQVNRFGAFSTNPAAYWVLSRLHHLPFNSCALCPSFAPNTTGVRLIVGLDFAVTATIRSHKSSADQAVGTSDFRWQLTPSSKEMISDSIEPFETLVSLLHIQLTTSAACPSQPGNKTTGLLLQSDRLVFGTHDRWWRHRSRGLQGTVARSRTPGWTRQKPLWWSGRWAHNLWKSSVSPGTSSSAEVRVVVVHDIKEEKGEKQQEVQEDEGNEEIGREINGEVRESHSTFAWDMAMTMRRTRHKLEPQRTVQQTKTTLTTKKGHYRQTNQGHSRVFGCCSWVCTCFRFAATSNILLCLSLCIRVTSSIVVNVPTYSLFTCKWSPCRFCRFSHCENGSFWGVVFAPPIGYSRPLSAVNEPSVKKKKRKIESHTSEVWSKDRTQQASPFYHKTLHPSSLIDFVWTLMKTTRIHSIDTKWRKNSMTVAVPDTSSMAEAWVVVLQILGVNGLV